MKIKKIYLKSEYLIFWIILLCLYLKLIFSYLLVKPSYWIRHLPVNSEVYNFLNLPENVSTKIEFLLIPILFLYTSFHYKFLGKFVYTYIICLGLLFLNFITSLITDISFLDSITITLKIISPIFLFLTLIILYKNLAIDLTKSVQNIIKFCILLTVVGILFLEISMNRMIAQWPVYFSNIHTHAYVLVCCFIFYSFLLYKNDKKTILMLFFIISFSILLIGYQVRTALLLYSIYTSVVLFLINDFFKYLWVKTIVLLPLVLGVSFFFINVDSADSISSGRLTMYAAKYELLKSYSFIDLMFGRGYGSDLIRTEEWWYANKNSHSDLITFIVENGILYLLGFMTLLLSFLRSFNRINLIYLSIICGYFITSLISNGIAVRPLAGYIFFIIMFFVLIETQEVKKQKILFFK